FAGSEMPREIERLCKLSPVFRGCPDYGGSLPSLCRTVVTLGSSVCAARISRAPVLRETRVECLGGRAAQSADERTRDAAWTPERSVCGVDPRVAAGPSGPELWRRPTRAGQ